MIEQTNAFMAVALAGSVAAPALILGAARNSRWAACKLLAYADARDAFSARYRESHDKYAKEFNITPAKSVPSTTDVAGQWTVPPSPAAEQASVKRRAILTVVMATPLWIGAVVNIFQEAGK